VTSYLRSVERKNKIIKTFSVSFYAKTVGMLVPFVMVPMAVDYLGKEQYGLWVAVSSLIAMLSFADGGVGNALVNMISRATGARSNIPLQPIISSGYFIISIIALIGVIVFLSVYSVIPWGWLFGLSDSDNSTQLSLLVLIVGAAFFLGMPFSVVGNIQRGFQEGNVQAFWNAKGSLLSLIFVYIAIQMDLGILGFAIAFVLGPISAAAANSIYYFFIKKKDLLPRLSLVSSTEAKAILGTGGLFFILQITAAIQMQADKVIIANRLGPSFVTQYAICMQLFLAVPMLMTLLWAPLWPAYREALASGDAQWIKRIFIKSMKLALIVGIPASFILIIFGQDIIRLWVGKNVIPSMFLLIGCGIWMLMRIVGNALAMLLNGLQVIKTQIVIASAAAALNIVLSVWLVSRVGVEGAVYGTILSFFVCSIVPYTLLIPKLFRDRVREVSV
jgi:O-antigen/teichoic acid export membrane protein